MTTPKPPEGEWIEFLIGQVDTADNFDPSTYHFSRRMLSQDSRTAFATIPKDEILKRSRAELAALRAKAAAYDEAMNRLYSLPELNMSNYTDDEVSELNFGVTNIIVAEIDAGRFTP